MVRKAPKGFKDKPKGGKGKSLSKRAISEISDAARFAEKIGSDKKFSDLAKQYKEYNVRYGRPATFRETYGEEVNKLGDPMGSTYYKDPVTGEERFFTAQAPTFRQLLGDIGGAFSSMGKGLAEKGTPMMNLAKSLFGGVQNFFGNQMDKAQGFFANQMASQNQFNQQLSSLTPQQRMVYDQLIFQPGMTRENAYAQAVGQGFAMGGIATLH